MKRILPPINVGNLEMMPRKFGLKYQLGRVEERAKGIFQARSSKEFPGTGKSQLPVRIKALLSSPELVGNDFL